ncbi:putative T7SS-secreted protein, partial [Streptomyces bungoensis]
MGAGDLADSLIGGAGDLVDGGKKLLGETIDKGSDIAADGLDMAGAHDWADNTRHYGDQAASALGATPGERQLGQSDDPTDLVHGNAEDILATARHLKHFHTAFDKVGQGMRKLDSSQWQGQAAEAFRKKFAMHPVKWLHAADACHQAAAALEHYADTVTWAQK